MRQKATPVEEDGVIKDALTRCERHQYLYLVSQGCDYCLKEGRTAPPQTRRP